MDNVSITVQRSVSNQNASYLLDGERRTNSYTTVDFRTDIYWFFYCLSI